MIIDLFVFANGVEDLFNVWGECVYGYWGQKSVTVLCLSVLVDWVVVQCLGNGSRGLGRGGGRERERGCQRKVGYVVF